MRANRPLAGVTVLDFGQVYQGPYATLLMAQAGADVIKIEPPQGEPLRRRAPPGKSTTFPIAMLNSNKRAITLNLKHERGRALLFRMAEKGDVLLEISSREVAAVIGEHVASHRDLELSEKTYAMTKDLFEHQAASRMALQQAESDLAKNRARVRQTEEAMRVIDPGAVFLVTGASGAIGYEIASQAAASKANSGKEK